MKTKKVTFSMTKTEETKLEDIATEVLGSANKSGMIRYWINKHNLKNCKSASKKNI